ncbi:hypothetical protein GJ496_004230 [Pomphorhynchus laevis]|nr:hypothetical protein GJ496_004230 [Pomphorhynchus laevis]
MTLDSQLSQFQLYELVRLPENKECADCRKNAPRWASCNIGVFLCIKCAGAHRTLGVHISRIKSISLDSWTEDQIMSMKNMGNRRAALIFEAKLPADFIRPDNDVRLRKFIRDKYERKIWFIDDQICCNSIKHGAIDSCNKVTSTANKNNVNNAFDLMHATHLHVEPLLLLDNQSFCNDESKDKDEHNNIISNSVLNNILDQFK